MVSLFIFTYSSTWPNEKSQPKLKATLGSRFFRRSCSREEQKPAKRRPRHSPARLPGVRRQRVTPEPSPSPLPGPVSYGRAPRALCPQPPGPWTVRPRPPGSPPAQGLARCWFRRHPSGSISFSPCHRHTRGSGAVASQHVGVEPLSAPTGGRVLRPTLIHHAQAGDFAYKSNRRPRGYVQRGRARHGDTRLSLSLSFFFLVDIRIHKHWQTSDAGCAFLGVEALWSRERRPLLGGRPRPSRPRRPVPRPPGSLYSQTFPPLSEAARVTAPAPVPGRRSSRGLSSYVV